MKDRILKNWTAVRAMYVLLGGAIIAGSIAERQWPGIFFGAYFASMGIFSFGCAAGNCAGGSCQRPTLPQSDNNK